MTVLETIIFGVLTLIVCGASLKASHGRAWLGVITFVGWIAYLRIVTSTEFSEEQAWLASLDAIQAALMFWVIRKYHLGFWTLMGLASAFTLMIGMHLSLFFIEDHAELPYHKLLNAAYCLQLSVIGGGLVSEYLRYSRRKNVSSVRSGGLSPVRSDRRGVG